MKTLIIVTVLVFISLLSLNCSHQPAFEIDDTADDITKLKYFSILVNTDDDSVFIKVEKEMAIDPLMSTYVLIVNITDDDPENHYIVFGLENDTNSIRQGFNTLTDETKRKLLEWDSTNKYEIKPKKKAYKQNN